MSDIDKSELDDVIDELKGIIALENNMVNLTFDPYEDAKKKLQALITQQCCQARIDELNGLPNCNIESTYHGSTEVILVKDVIKRIGVLEAQAKETEKE